MKGENLPARVCIELRMGRRSRTSGNICPKPQSLSVVACPVPKNFEPRKACATSINTSNIRVDKIAGNSQMRGAIVSKIAL